MKKYVVGLAFWNDCVLLIHKERGPEYVIGTWNGIGGKIEDKESADMAMAREFLEETGIKTEPSDWKFRAVMNGNAKEGNDYTLTIFMTNLLDDEDYSEITNPEENAEEICWHYLEAINEATNLTPNLAWIIPLCLDETTPTLFIKEV